GSSPVRSATNKKPSRQTGLFFVFKAIPNGGGRPFSFLALRVIFSIAFGSFSPINLSSPVAVLCSSVWNRHAREWSFLLLSEVNKASSQCFIYVNVTVYLGNGNGLFGRGYGIGINDGICNLLHEAREID
ncbi:hypothetical protein, partial [Aeromonas enteropelogenes]|uniref:hypothetical protein n=1 Tax=Aeromonas enteropelogenes TaxID=29489 RepID=UPI003F747F9D